jgi:hypothetical protein
MGCIGCSDANGLYEFKVLLRIIRMSMVLLPASPPSRSHTSCSVTPPARPPTGQPGPLAFQVCATTPPHSDLLIMSCHPSCCALVTPLRTFALVWAALAVAVSNPGYGAVSSLVWAPVLDMHPRSSEWARTV